MKLWVLHCLKILEMVNLLVSHGIPMHVAPWSVGYFAWHFFCRNSEKYFCRVQSWPFFLLKHYMNLEITYVLCQRNSCLFFVFLWWTQFSGNPVDDRVIYPVRTTRTKIPLGNSSFATGFHHHRFHETSIGSMGDLLGCPRKLVNGK